MAHYVERYWNPGEGLSRRDRQPGTYNAYVPDELGKDLPRLSAPAREAAESALVALGRADERIGESGAFFSHLLVRSEAISSSWIEGNRVTPKRLAITEVSGYGSAVAKEVVANVHATEKAVAKLADRNRPITVDDIVELQHTVAPHLNPGLRTEQNWVGGNGYSPLRADFVPPPETEVHRLVTDLTEFITATSGNPIVRAAIAHAQFETIHPFIDGNGRTGRALIHTVLFRSDAIRNILLPISTVFSGNIDVYLAGLGSYRSIPPCYDDWVISFAEAVERAAENALGLTARLRAQDKSSLEQLVSYRQSRGLNPAVPRRGAVVYKIVTNLASQPVLTVASVVNRWGVSPAAAYSALRELAEADVLSRVKSPKGKLLCYTANQHLALATLAERSNRAGGQDTVIKKPKRGPDIPDIDKVGRLWS